MTSAPQEVNLPVGPPPGCHAPRYTVQIQPYTGRDNATEWWTMFMGFVMLQRMPDADAILMLPFHLTSIAKEWFNTLDGTIKQSLETI